MIQLDEVNENEIKDYFPDFIEDLKRYFFIIDDKLDDIGLYGLKSRDDYEEGAVEISLYIFKKNRYHKQYKELLICLLNYPFYINYKSILIHTEEKSIRTLLKMCHKLNVIPLNADETWFYRGVL
jgi:hypothetical protein